MVLQGGSRAIIAHFNLNHLGAMSLDYGKSKTRIHQVFVIVVCRVVNFIHQYILKYGKVCTQLVEKTSRYCFTFSSVHQLISIQDAFEEDALAVFDKYKRKQAAAITVIANLPAGAVKSKGVGATLTYSLKRWHIWEIIPSLQRQQCISYHSLCGLQKGLVKYFSKVQFKVTNYLAELKMNGSRDSRHGTRIMALLCTHAVQFQNKVT